MQRYGNAQGHSGVALYESGPDFIRVVFGPTPSTVYVYDYEVPGREHVEHMKALAESGRGLSTYISRHVRDKFRRKESR